MSGTYEFNVYIYIYARVWVTKKKDNIIWKLICNLPLQFATKHTFIIIAYILFHPNLVERVHILFCEKYDEIKMVKSTDECMKLIAVSFFIIVFLFFYPSANSGIQT